MCTLCVHKNLKTMKQLFLMALLFVCGYTAQAQFVANGSGCDVEYRQICIDPGTCTISYPSTTWISIPATSMVSLTITSCNPGEIVGFEVRYDAGSTGCTNTPTIIQDQSAPPVPCPGVVQHGQMGFCPCSGNANGLDIHFNGLNLHIDG